MTATAVGRWRDVHTTTKGAFLYEDATRDYFGLPLSPPGLSAWTRLSRVVHTLWAIAPGLKPTIQFSAERGVPEIVLESSWRDANADNRIRPHVEVVGALLAAL